MHRHYNCDVWLFVQHWERVDLVLRELIQNIYVVQPTMFNSAFVRVRKINCKIDIAEGQIAEIFDWVFFAFGLRYYYHRKARQLFNSYSRDELAFKEFPVWSGDNQNILETVETKKTLDFDF